MFIDASAIVAILAREPGSEALLERILKIGGGFYVSPLVRLEVVLALSREKRAAADNPSGAIKQAEAIYEQFVNRIGAEEIKVTTDLGRAAVSASAAFGKAAGHPARLNFGDCFAYACARSLGVGLVYKGDDFAKTDLA
ncbi:MAG: type II toxin-antitoxin system VapC family toxin [Pseudomonadota bacterium]